MQFLQLPKSFGFEISRRRKDAQYKRQIGGGVPKSAGDSWVSEVYIEEHLKNNYQRNLSLVKHN